MTSFQKIIKTVYIALIFFLHAMIVFAQTEEQEMKLPENDQCIVCHIEVELMPEDFLPSDIHMQEGLSCAGCHGGDPTTDDQDEAMSEDNGFVGIPSFEQIPQFCAKCHSNGELMRRYQPRIHTDQYEQYFISQHGKKLKEGNSTVAQCASCHSAHAILPASDSRSTLHALNLPSTCQKCHGDSDYMAGSLPTDQFEKYAQSVHGKALLEDQDIGAPACNDCHGNHGAVPPEVSSIDQVCGTCHINNQQYFSITRMAEEFAANEMHACAECHNYHDIQKTNDDMIGIHDSSVCMNCHGEGDKGYEASEKIYNHLKQSVTIYDSALVRQKEVQRIGMDDVEIEFVLQEANQNLIQARTLVHTFDPEKVGEKTNVGIAKANEALQMAANEIKDHRTRRMGFGMATFFITILVIALWLKIRDIEKKKE